MHIIRAEPPLMREIEAAFKTRGRPGVAYCWGHDIFVPVPPDPDESIIAHERIHAARQQQFVDDDGERGISAWWLRYIRDPAFRLAEEIPAHQAEFGYWLKQPDRPRDGFRSGHQYHLNMIAKRLASPLYGGLISLADAKKVIADGRC